MATEPVLPYTNREAKLLTFSMRPISDLMMSLLELTDNSVRQRVRKTAEDPPRVSVYDVIGVITGQSSNACRVIYSRLVSNHPEVATICCDFKFSGRGQQPIPVCDARSIVELVMILPGRAATAMRRQAARVLVRFLGGDMSMVEEIARNRLTQEELAEDDPNHPLRLFGATVEHEESEAIKRKREEVTLSELELQLCEQSGALKRRRIESVQYCLAALEGSGNADDRDKQRCTDMIREIAFGAAASSTDQPQDKEICIREIINAAGRGREVGLDCKLGKAAKKLLLSDKPQYVFPRKNIFCNGQSMECNMWLASQRSYIERALAAM
jgi:hypothetical protein